MLKSITSYSDFVAKQDLPVVKALVLIIMLYFL